MGVHKAIWFLYDLLISITTFVLTHFFGRSIESNGPFSYLKGYKFSDVKKLSPDTIDFYGYKAAKNVIITFCGIIFLLYSVFFCCNFRPLYIVTILNNPFLTLISGILFLVLLDSLFPVLLFHLLNLLVKMKRNHIFKPVKF